MDKPVCAVVGIGPGNGEAFARRFAAEGYAVALLSRSTELSETIATELDGARAYACDVSDAAAIESAFASIREQMGDIEVLLYNAGSGVFGNVESIDAAALEQSWRINALGLFRAGREVIGPMKAAGKGSIIVTGATASLRGGANFTAFASAKAAQRNLAQSMARHLGPAGIHVALVIVDGVIDLPGTRERMGDKPDDHFLKAEDIAETVFRLVVQPRSAWSFEVDVRPYCEKW